MCTLAFRFCFFNTFAFDDALAAMARFPRSFGALFLRCLREWLTMCRVVVIIKQFREFSLACLYTVVPSDTQPAIEMGAEICLAEL